MAASMNVATVLKGKCQKMLHTVRFRPRVIPGWLHARHFSSNTESVISEYEIEAEEFERKLAKIRDCSKLNKKEKLRHHGKMPEENYSETYRGDKRRKLRTLYAEYGSASGIDPGIMYPSRAELADLIDVEKNWTLSFQQMQKNLEEKKAAEALAARLRDEKINKAMQKMPQLLKQYNDKQKKLEEDERKRDKTESLLEDFRETYGFTVKPDSTQFKAFKKLKSEEMKTLKALQKKEEKKASSMKSLKKILEEQVKAET